jgi:hypothetical protein
MTTFVETEAGWHDEDGPSMGSAQPVRTYFRESSRRLRFVPHTEHMVGRLGSKFAEVVL